MSLVDQIGPIPLIVLAFILPILIAGWFAARAGNERERRAWIIAMIGPALFLWAFFGKILFFG